MDMDGEKMTSSYCATAPSKVILFGEHSVVHGTPAIAVALNIRSKARINLDLEPQKKGFINIISKELKEKRVYSLEEIKELVNGNNKKFGVLDPFALELGIILKEEFIQQHNINLVLESEIPVGAGLGSSASVSTSVAGAGFLVKQEELDPQQVRKVAFEGEKITHGKPSGIDNTITSLGGMVYFKKGEEPVREEIKYEIPLIIANTKVPRSTARLVAAVAERLERRGTILRYIFDSISNIVEQGRDALKKGDLSHLGELMDINHGLLHGLGVSHPLLDKYVWIAREAGALGAKLTGAGGGGCMIALAEDSEKAQLIKEALISVGAEVFSTVLTNEGVTKC